MDAQVRDIDALSLNQTVLREGVSYYLDSERLVEALLQGFTESLHHGAVMSSPYFYFGMKPSMWTP